MQSPMTRFMIIFCLLFSGEAIFGLTFHVPRFFRPQLLEVFQFSNTQLGDIYAAYGLAAMASYFLGGPIADRFSTRRLLTVSLIATAMGGLVMAYIPGAIVMTLLYAYWGVSSILLFWAAMIRATREWGGTIAQGKAFGILDGGRGLVAAASASLAVASFGWVLPPDVTLSTSEQNQQGLQSVIYLYTGITFFAAVLTWVFIPDTRPQSSPPSSKRQRQSLAIEVTQVIHSPIVWAIAGIVICSYCGFKALDNYGLYAVEVLSMNALESSEFISNAAYLRIGAAITAGLIADRFSASKIIGISFTLLIISYLFLANSASLTTVLVYGNVIITFVLVYGLRGVYFALLEEAKTPTHLTGTTVGAVSLLGYTPDFFFGPIAGRILDRAPGLQGYLDYFAFLSVIMIIGLTTVLVFVMLSRRRSFST